MKVFTKYLVIFAAITIVTCLTHGIVQAMPPAAESTDSGSVPAVTGKIIETFDVESYTYVQLDTGKEKIWAAGPKVKVNVGDTVSLAPGMPMQNFHSNSLDRTFELIYFVPAIFVGKPGEPASQQEEVAPHHGSAQDSTAPDLDLTGIEKIENGYTVAELYKSKQSLAGKNVSVRGKVVKVNNGIMGKNWLHLRDGSDFEGNNDLTVTSAATAETGSIIIATGILVMDKDFGHGYQYALILEDVELKIEQE